MDWPGALRFLPTETEIMERQVGLVHELFQLYWPDGGPWICARATVTDPPIWLKRHETTASFRRWDIHSTPVGESLPRDLRVRERGLAPDRDRTQRAPRLRLERQTDRKADRSSLTRASAHLRRRGISTPRPMRSSADRRADIIGVR